MSFHPRLDLLVRLSSFRMVACQDFLLWLWLLLAEKPMFEPSSANRRCFQWPLVHLWSFTERSIAHQLDQTCPQSHIHVSCSISLYWSEDKSTGVLWILQLPYASSRKKDHFEAIPTLLSWTYRKHRVYPSPRRSKFPKDLAQSVFSPGRRREMVLWYTSPLSSKMECVLRDYLRTESISLDNCRSCCDSRSWRICRAILDTSWTLWWS